MWMWCRRVRRGSERGDGVRGPGVPGGAGQPEGSRGFRVALRARAGRSTGGHQGHQGHRGVFEG